MFQDRGPGEATGLAAGVDRSRLSPARGERRASISVVIPTLDEALNLPHVLPLIPRWVDEVILVDGGSKDDTVSVARELLPGIRVIGQKRPGKGAALQAGFVAARGDIIVTLDADGSTDPREIPAFVGTLLAGADYAKGSRFAQGGGTDDMEQFRKLGNWALRSTVRLAFGGRYSDLCYGYNAFWRHVVPIIAGEADGFEIETLMNIRVLAAGLKVSEVPSHEALRLHGQSHLRTMSDGWRVLRTIVREHARHRSHGVPAMVGATMARAGRRAASPARGIPVTEWAVRSPAVGAAQLEAAASPSADRADANGWGHAASEGG